MTSVIPPNAYIHIYLGDKILKKNSSIMHELVMLYTNKSFPLLTYIYGVV